MVGSVTSRRKASSNILTIRQGVVLLLCPAQFRPGTSPTRLALVEQGNGKLDEWTDFPCAFSALCPCSQGYLWNESGCARDAELLTSYNETLPGAGQVEALTQCLRFQPVGGQQLGRN